MPPMDPAARRVMEPGDPSLHGLAVQFPDRWPELAAEWLALGYDSQMLRDFASLSRSEAVALAEVLMPDVLRSLGVEVPHSDDFAISVFELSGFANRCRVALGTVQTDLDRTGYRELRLEPRNATGGDQLPLNIYPSVIGKGWAATGSPLLAGLDDEELLLEAAVAVTDALTEVAKIRWPRCAEHPGRVLATRYLAPSGGPEQSWWWCDRDDGHPVAVIGELKLTDVGDSTMAGT